MPYNVLNTKTEVVILNPDGTEVGYATYEEAKEVAERFTIKTGVEHAPIG